MMITVMWFLSGFIAFFIKGVCGFADALILGGIMNAIVSPALVTPVGTLLAFPSNIILAWRSRSSVRFRECIPVAAVLVLGDTIGILLLQNTDVSLLKVFFGILMAVLGIEMFLRIRHGSAALHSSRPLMAAIGLTAGVTCGLFGVGALMSAYFSRTTESPEAFRGNLCAVFVADNIFRLTAYVVTGILNAAVLVRWLTVLPFALLGLLAGSEASQHLDAARTKQVISVMLVISGLVMFFSNLRF